MTWEEYKTKRENKKTNNSTSSVISTKTETNTWDAYKKRREEEERKRLEREQKEREQAERERQKKINEAKTTTNVLPKANSNFSNLEDLQKEYDKLSLTEQAEMAKQINSKTGLEKLALSSNKFNNTPLVNLDETKLKTEKDLKLDNLKTDAKAIGSNLLNSAKVGGTQLLKSMAMNVDKTQNMYIDAGNKMNEMIIKEMEKEGKDTSHLKQAYREKYDSKPFYQEKINKLNQKMAENTEKATNPTSRKIAEISQGLGNNIVGAVATAINPTAGLIYFTGSAKGSYYDEAIQRGMSEEEAENYSGVMALMEGVTERYLAGENIKGFKNILKGQGFKNAVKSFGIEVGENFVQEAVMPSISEVTALATAGKEHLNYDFTTAEGWENLLSDSWSDGIDGALSSIMLNGATKGVASATRVVNKMKNGQTVTQKEIATAVEDSQKAGVDVEGILQEEIKNVAEKKVSQEATMANQNNQTLQNNIDTNIENTQKQGMTQEQQLPVATGENTYSNQLKQTASEEINNSNIPKSEKNMMLDVLNGMDTITDADLTAIRDTIEAIKETQQLDSKGQYKNDQARRQKYVKYKNDTNTYDDSAVNEVLDMMPKNRNGRRTVKQWLQTADEIGKRIANLSNEEIERIAYKSWFDIQPSKSITQYDNVAKKQVGFQKFTSDEWINAINNAVNEARANNQTQWNVENNQETVSELDEILNNRDLPMQGYKYEVSDNVKINQLRQQASRHFNDSEQTHKFIKMLEKIIEDKDIEIRLDANLKTADGRVANGSYSNGVITINPNSARTGEFIAIHELTHAIGTKSMMNIIENYRKSNTEFNSAVESLLQNYNATELTEEALSDVSAQLFGNQEFINNIANTNPGFFKKIYNEIKYLWHQFRGYKNQNQFVEDLYYKWTQAYNSNNKLNGTNNYSIAGINAVNNIRNNTDLYNQAMDNYNLAKKMAKQGKNNVEIMEKTGWFKDDTGKLKFSFSDKDMSLKNINFKEGEVYTLEQILNHDTLFMFYPELKYYTVEFKDLNKGRKEGESRLNGAFSRKDKEIRLDINRANFKMDTEGTLIHEIQHAIQNIEGFTRGTSIKAGKRQYQRSLGEREARDTANRFINEKYNGFDMSNVLPESAIFNRNILDKMKDAVYNYFNKFNQGVSNEEVGETNKENSKRNKILVVDGINGQENSNKSSFSMDNKGRALTKEQQEYFKDSKVRDENGNLLEVYHGTKTKGINIFNYDPTRQTGTDYGKAYYFTTDYIKAQGYQYDIEKDPLYIEYSKQDEKWKERVFDTENEDDRSKLIKEWSNWHEENNVMELLNNEEFTPERLPDGETKKLYLNIKNPYIADAKGQYYFKVYDDYFKEARANGNDGIIVKNVIDVARGEHRPIDVYIAFNENQIKNIDNTNPTENPDIRYSISEDTENGVEALEKYKENKRKAYKNIANEFGKSTSYWESNLDGLDKESVKRFLKRTESVRNKYIKDNNINIETVYKPVEYKAIGSNNENVQSFVKDNDITVSKLANDINLRNEYFNLVEQALQEKYNTGLEDVQKITEQWKNYFEEQSHRGETVIWVLKRFERDFELIKSGDTQQIDSIATEENVKKILDESKGFDKYINKLVDPLFNEKPQLSTEKLTELAQDTFGTTIDFSVGAYMTPDGKLLNFNENGYRRDHREIGSIGYDMQEFIDAGNIRMKPEGNGFELTLEPTLEQYNTLAEYIDSLNGEIYIEIDIGKNKYDGANYKEGTPTSKIISDLQYYFKNGKFPVKSEFADFRYSQNNESWQQHLDKNFKATGTRTNMKDVGINVASTAKNNVLSVGEYTKQQNKAEEQKQIAKILDEPMTKQKEKSRIWAIAKANIIDKGIVFEELSRKANNRELQGKWDYTLSAEARGQNAIGKARYERNPKTKTEKQISKSLEDIREEVGNKTHDFQQYMYHQLNIDRMTLEERFSGDTGINYERKNAIKNKPVFGNSVTADISRKIVTEYEQKNPEFKKWAKDVYDFLDANKKELVDRGVISQELSDKLAEMYPHYVPIKRVDAKGMAIKLPLDTNRTGVNVPLAKATGGSSDIQPLFQTIADRTMQTYRASARNNFGVELMNTLNSITETSNADIDTIIEEIGETDTELLKEGKNGNNPTFTVFKNGEKITFEITKDMYDALKPQSEWIKNLNNSKLSKGLNKVSNFRRGVLTEYNPVFFITNPIKDFQDIVFNSQHPAKTYAKIPEAYAQIMQKGYWYNEYMQNGGEQNSYFKDGEFTSDKKVSKLKKAVTIPLETISKINNVMEMAPRLAEYIASREAGTSIETSMLDASRVTTNFKAGGDVTKTLNRNGVTFLNASVQGMQQQIRNIQEANAKGLKGYAVLATKYAIAGLPVALLNGLIWKDDDDYEELQDYAKDNYYIIAKYGDGKFIRIPKGRASATIQKIVGNAMEYVTDDKKLNIDNLGKDFWEDLKFTQDNLAPNNPLDNNILSPIIQAIANTSWYGEDIVPSRLKDKPAEEQYDESIDSLSISIGSKLGISPYKINYLLDQYGGGISDIALPIMTKQAENNMFTDKFTTDSVMKNKHPEEFYESLDNLKEKANSAKATDEDILKYKYISSISSSMNELYQEKREIQNSNATDKTKKEKLRIVQEKINKIAKEAVENNSKIRISGNTATINDTQFYKAPNVSDGTMKWSKVSDKEKEKNKNISLKTYADYKNKIANETIKQRKNGIISDEGQIKDKDKIQVLLNSNYSSKEKEELYQNYILSSNDKNYNIIKESFSSSGLNIQKYLEYKNQEFSADKEDDGTVDGKTVSGSKKGKVWTYIENMNISYTQKLLLYGLEYTPSDSQQKQILNYVKSLPNKTNKEKLEILSQFKGFTIYKDGTVGY